MKAYMIIIVLTLAAFLLFQSYMIADTNSTELKTYKIVKKVDNIEIRFYPATTLATVNSNAKSYRELASPGFRKLAGFIFGGNNKNIKIPMTSPVQMDINNESSSMSFIMPKGYDSSNLPIPNDNGVKIQQSTDEYVAAIRFGGFVNEKKIEDYKKKLIDILYKNNIKTLGNCRYLGYNPPYQLFGRRNELIIRIDWK
jgi:hypothetical protein